MRFLNSVVVASSAVAVVIMVVVVIVVVVVVSVFSVVSVVFLVVFSVDMFVAALVDGVHVTFWVVAWVIVVLEVWV